MYKLGYKFKFQLCGTADLFVFFLCYAHFLFLFTCFKAADMSVDYYSSVSKNLQKFSAALKKKMTETEYISFL